MQDLLVQFIMNYGLAGVFLAAIGLNASVLLPLPFDIIFVFIAGLRVFNPLFLGIAAGAGAAMGEMVGYATGYFGSKTIEKMTHAQTGKVNDFKNRIKNLGTIFIFIGALIPFPFDFIGIAAGLIKFDWKRFLAAAMLGRIIRHVLIAYAIFYGLEAIQAVFLH
ncbi:MAG: VTT domain-containing protein [Candidatus ainarchaeum sp.]|nr:VTT domain-containing protein [Candidatus ainarchaeum sp.]